MSDISFSFIPYADETARLVEHMISDPLMHSRWLNTLSYLENCGARKIAGCEHPTKVRQDMLRHAAEEFRHAYHLKSQMRKLREYPFIDYRPEYMVGGVSTRQYLVKLDVEICRFLKTTDHILPEALKEIAYLLVTYAIERRAGVLYPIYQKALNASGSNISMRSIIAEEDRHLAEMEEELSFMTNSQTYMEFACGCESSIFYSWYSNLVFFERSC